MRQTSMNETVFKTKDSRFDIIYHDSSYNVKKRVFEHRVVGRVKYKSQQGRKRMFKTLSNNGWEKDAVYSDDWYQITEVPMWRLK